MKVCFETFGCRLNRAEALDREAVFADLFRKLARSVKK